MRWKKLGHVFNHKQKQDWIENSALTPTPFLINSHVIRVYCGFRDKYGVSRIGYVDVSAQDPTQVIGVSSSPVLDIGDNGCFDDNGVIMGDIVRVDNNTVRMYYIGFQLVKKAKFLAYTGLAESHDGGETFQRVKKSPVLDRSDNGLTINAIHTVIKENGKWKAWYAAGCDWEIIEGKQYPRYNIRYTESDDGIKFNIDTIDKLCVDVINDEYRIGRPSVYYMQGRYLMFYTKGGRSGKDYFPGIAFSGDGVEWIREDDKLGLSLSNDGFDSKHLCYPRLVDVKGKIYCFYNGNNMGVDGFGVAELIND
ncbi:hypothetical protein [Aeromonas veronii]